MPMTTGGKAKVATYLVLSGLLVTAIWLRTGDFTLDDKVLWSNGSVSLSVFEILFLPASIILLHAAGRAIEGAVDFLNDNSFGRTVLLAFIVIGLAGVLHVFGITSPIEFLGGLFRSAAGAGP